MAEIIIGDYRYNTDGSVKCVDETKQTYGPILSQFEYGGNFYTVTNMYACFEDCTSLTQAPAIPSSITNLGYCFDNCISLTLTPVIPSSVTNMFGCFKGCTSLTQAPVIPNGVTDMESCFSDCSSLTQVPEIPSSVRYIRYCFSGCSLITQAPEIPSGVTNMRECFFNCTSLIQAPDIPSDVTDMRLCFYNCYKLKGDINVYNNPTDFNNIFIGTVNDIYIVNCATSTKEAVAEKWRTIVSNRNNVHYEADDHPEPQLSLSVRRTDENKKSSSMGSYLVFQKSYIISQDLLPENFAPAHVESETYKLDSEVILPIVDASGESEAIQLGDSNGHVVSYTLNDGYKTRTITANLSKIMAILDFLGRGNQAGYIDLPGMGMAIGNIATRNGLDIQFPTTIGEGLLPPTTNKVYTKAELPFDSSKTYYILNDDKYEEVINPVEEDIDNYYELTSQSVDLSNYQLVIGKYNKRDDKALFIIGNGTVDNRKNSFIIDEDGYMDVVNGFEIKVEDKALLQFLKINDSDTRIRLGAADGSNIVIGDLGIEMFHVLADKNAKSYIHNETLVETLPSEDLAGSCLSLANNSDVPNGTINKVELRAINGTTYNNWAVVSATIKKLANGTNQNIIRFDANRVESRVAIVVDSDRRLKKHINYLDKDAIDFCRELKPVVYSKNNEKHLGFYAQDVKEINKWDADLTPLINKDYMGLSYDELIAPLVAYCQYLEKRIDELESQK